MGTDYCTILDNIINSGCLDIYPKKNKFLGGYHFRNHFLFVYLILSQILKIRFEKRLVQQNNIDIIISNMLQDLFLPLKLQMILYITKMIL